MHLSGAKLTLEQILLARISDELALIFWTKTKDGQRNINRPKSVLESLLHPEGQENENISYATGEEFMAAWHKLNGG